MGERIYEREGRSRTADIEGGVRERTSICKVHIIPTRARIATLAAAERKDKRAAGLAAGHACAERIVPRGVEIEAA